MAGNPATPNDRRGCCEHGPDAEAVLRDGRLLGELIDRAHLTPPHGLSVLFAEHAAVAGFDDLVIYLQDYEQQSLLPLPGGGEDPPPVPVNDSLPGRAFTGNQRVEAPTGDGATRLWVPLINGTDRVGVLGVTVAAVDDGLRRTAGGSPGSLRRSSSPKGSTPT